MPVPAGATSGSVVVTVGGLASNSARLHGHRGADADESVADERACWDGRDASPAPTSAADHTNAGGLSTVTFNGTMRDADDLGGDEHRRAGAGGRDERQRRGRRSGGAREQHARLHGHRGADADESVADERASRDKP